MNIDDLDPDGGNVGDVPEAARAAKMELLRIEDQICVLSIRTDGTILAAAMLTAIDLAQLLKNFRVLLQG